MVTWCCDACKYIPAAPTRPVNRGSRLLRNFTKLHAVTANFLYPSFFSEHMTFTPYSYQYIRWPQRLKHCGSVSILIPNILGRSLRSRNNAFLLTRRSYPSSCTRHTVPDLNRWTAGDFVQFPVSAILTYHKARFASGNKCTFPCIPLTVSQI